MLARAHGDHDARTGARPDDHVLRLRRAVHEVPRTQRPLLAFDDEHRFARDDEEVLLIGLPVVPGHRLARHQHERVDAELRGPPPAFEVVVHDADGAAAVGVTPFGVAQAEDVPAVTLRDQSVLRLLQFRLGDHERKPSA
jgi:hypothetical protein